MGAFLVSIPCRLLPISLSSAQRSPGCLSIRVLSPIHFPFDPTRIVLIQNQAFEVFEKKREIFIVMELCSGGDLYRRLPYSESDSAKITTKLLSAIKYMHDHDIVHRDRE